jgi:hypothetical protein
LPRCAPQTLAAPDRVTLRTLEACFKPLAKARRARPGARSALSCARVPVRVPFVCTPARPLAR